MPLPSTRTLLKLHRYAGLVTAPLLLFFAISGVWQVFRLNETRKDGTYTAPKALELASHVHKAERLRAGPAGLAFKLAASAAGVLLVLTTAIGIVAALRITRPRWLSILLLFLGTAAPLLLYLIAAKRGVG
jgi:hypothetical protein